MRNKGIGIVAIAALLVAVAFAAMPADSAEAHNRTVTHPRSGEVVNEGWSGGGVPGGVPANENGLNGLILGGPDGTWKLPAAHDGGLNTACEALEDNPSAVDIRGPGPNCPHGQ